MHCMQIFYLSKCFQISGYQYICESRVRIFDNMYASYEIKWTNYWNESDFVFYIIFKRFDHLSLIVFFNEDQGTNSVSYTR